MDNKKEIGNPYGAGRYGYIRSSEDCEAMILGRKACFELSCNRWIEHIWRGYACWRDGKAELEWDGLYRDEFLEEHPLISYMEAFYELEYGNTRDEVATAWFCLKDRKGKKHRAFHFEISNVSMQEFDEYIAALKKWHMTGELNIGAYTGVPEFGPWQDW